MRPPLVSTAVSLALACASPTTPNGGQFTVQASPPVLELSNHTPAAVYSFPIERGAAAYTDWAPCSDPTRCAAVRVGQSTTVAYSQIAGYTAAAREAIVYWWHLVPGGPTGFQPDTIRAVVVTL
jgi:hypothetical protein